LTPAYLKIQELKQLADEVRSEISFIMSRKCQPSGPGRSVVDLTIAIHYVFNAPMDKILWDAGQHVRHLSVTVLNCQIPFLLKLSDIIFAQLSHLYFFGSTIFLQQAYAHKILTGRRSLFHTIKQKNGLSGFTSRFESEYDPFGAGHGCNSLSAGLGTASLFITFLHVKLYTYMLLKRPILCMWY
jgi:1-deoxy-D-xylulose-5-phosphate synthase